MRTRYSPSAISSSHFASRSTPASFAGRGAAARRLATAARVWPLLLGEHDRVAQHDLEPRIRCTARLQVLHHGSPSRARRRSFGNVLLGQPLGHDLLAIDVLSHVEEQARHAAVHVQQSQAADRRSASRRRFTRPRMTAIVMSKFSCRHFLKSRFEIERSSHGSMLITVAERGSSSIRPISPKIARTEDGKDHFLAFGVAHHDLEPAERMM